MELDKRCVILRAKCDRLTMVQLLALTRQRGNICLAMLSSLILSTEWLTPKKMYANFFPLSAAAKPISDKEKSDKSALEHTLKIPTNVCS